VLVGAEILVWVMLFLRGGRRERKGGKVKKN